MKSSQAGFNLIVTEEDGGEAYYKGHYTHFEWPTGASGPTFGIGYDAGYSTREQIAHDWSAYVSAATLVVMQRAAGLKGEAAHSFVRSHGREITIDWETALKQFSEHELLKWEDIVTAHLPNTDKLNGDCFGAITSITFNRGPSFTMPGARYAEMRSIKAHMSAQNFRSIPSDILSMCRLWPIGGDLWRRRRHEADLFSQGLKSMGLTS